MKVSFKYGISKNSKNDLISKISCHILPSIWYAHTERPTIHKQSVLAKCISIYNSQM